MKTQLLLYIFLVSGIFCFGQSTIQKECLNRLAIKCHDVEFKKTTDRIKINGDTIEFKRSKIVVSDARKEVFELFENGLIYPALIIGASTGGDGQFKLPSIEVIETINMSSFEPEPELNSSNKTRTFSFLVWKKGMANPYLYLLQIKNEDATLQMSYSDFVKGAHVISLGFCSILI
jgi:hypothetical protein